jgi:hypothetical protein
MSDAKLEWLASVHRSEFSTKKMIERLDNVSNSSPEVFAAVMKSDPELVIRMLREVSAALKVIQKTHLETVELHLELLDRVEKT